MNFRDPFAAYNAASNLEAHLICGFLRDAGVEAQVVEDTSQIGTWIGGSVSELHKPQVWIDRTDADKAQPVLVEYERRAAERRAAEEAKKDAAAPISAVCEDCGKRSEFPAALNGTVQTCPHCWSHMDVGEVEIEGWDESFAEADSENPPSEEL